MAGEIRRGWPDGGSIVDNFPPAAASGIVEGMAVKLNAGKEWVKADGTAGEVAWFAFDDGTAKDVIGANRFPAALNGIVRTTEYVAGIVYAPGDRLQVSAVGGQAGLATAHLGGAAPTYGYVTRGEYVFDGVTYLEFYKCPPNNA